MTSRPGTGMRRPYYPSSTVERLAVDALQSTGLFPSSPAPVRVERFVEKHFTLGVEYKALPAGVLGCTVFEDGRVRRIVVAKRLDEDPSRVAERRLRTTLAHEAGHGLMHAALFNDSYEPSLFDSSQDVQGEKVLCRDGEAGGSRYDGKWWEVQANMMIGPLLLPKTLALDALEGFTLESELGVRVLPAEKRHAAYLELADIFNVNPVVAEIRLEGLFPRASTDQLTL